MWLADWWRLQKSVNYLSHKETPETMSPACCVRALGVGLHLLQVVPGSSGVAGSVEVDQRVSGCLYVVVDGGGEAVNAAANDADHEERSDKEDSHVRILSRP
ncbi:MAG: hypothetical protein BWY68_00586 [bacterium ADurb.Bin400]|nr:MAG: hypothetical protein BWY68_00586 [bacterium ADurb.Bin400]